MRNGVSSVAVVAGDHDRADAGALEALDGVARLEARRVNHADQTDKGQVFFCRAVVIQLLRQRQNAQRVVCHGAGSGHDVLFILFGDVADLAVHQDADAARQHDVDSALGKGDNAAFRVVAVDGGHHLAARIKGLLVDAGHDFFNALARQPKTLAHVQKGQLSRVADAAAAFGAGVVAQDKAL